MAGRIADKGPRWVPEVQPLAWITVSTGEPAVASEKNTRNSPLPITVGGVSVMARTVLVARQTGEE